MLDVILKRFDQPDETRTFSKGKFDLVHIGGMTIGRATYEPAGAGPSTSVLQQGSRTAPSNT